MKKILAGLLATSVAVCTSVTAFAADYTTSTEYVLGEGVVNVTSTATGLNAGEDATYLAKGGDKILYIDQAVADGTGSVTFEYTANAGDIASSVVKFGAKESTVTAVGAYDDEIATQSVTVTAPKATVKVDGLDVTEGFILGRGQEVAFTVEAADGFLVKAVKINGVDATVAGSYTLTAADVRSIVVETEAIVYDPEIIEVVLKGSTMDSEVIAEKGFAIFVKCANINDSVSEYGIKYATDSYKAYDINAEGAYAVRLVNGEGTVDYLTEDAATAEAYLTVDGSDLTKAITSVE